MNAKKLMDEINRIFGIAFVQKAFRLILRAAWVAGAVYLMFWGMNQLWGFFPNTVIWTVFSFLTGVAIVLSLFLRRQPDNEFVWRLDQRFGLKEQVYTAYELSEGKELASGADESSITSQLAMDAAAPLPEIRRRVVNQGWNLRPEVESALVVLILLLVVYLNSVRLVTQLPPGGAIGLLPGLGSDPSAEQVLAAGSAGSGSDAAGLDQPSNSQQDPVLNDLLDLTPPDFDVISRILRNLGEALDKESATSELGESLKNQDYTGAAEEFGKLAETISQVSPRTRRELADQFLDTAVALQQASQQDISAYFQRAADALYGNSYSAMSDSLDELGAVMQVLAQYKQNQVIVDQPDDPASGMPIDRLTTQGQDIEIGAEEGFEDLISVPDGASGEVVSSGGGQEVDFSVPSDVIVQEGIWQSYDLSLDDVDVVSTYFSSR